MLSPNTASTFLESRATGGEAGRASSPDSRDSCCSWDRVHAPQTSANATIRKYCICCHHNGCRRMAIIEARGLTKVIDTGTHRVEILRGVEFEVPAGQFVAIMGASGSGKSTLLGLLAGLDSPTSGTITIDGVDITGLNEDKLAVVRGRKIGFVFQSYQLIPTLTAEENVLLPFELAGGDVSMGLKRARDLLASVGLSDRLDHY